MPKTPANDSVTKARKKVAKAQNRYMKAVAKGERQIQSVRAEVDEQIARAKAEFDVRANQLSDAEGCHATEEPSTPEQAADVVELTAATKATGEPAIVAPNGTTPKPPAKSRSGSSKSSSSSSPKKK